MKASSHSQGAQAGRRRRWGWLLPLLVGAAFLAEIAFLGGLDMAKNAEAVESWTTAFYRRSAPRDKGASPGGGLDDDPEIRQCVERLEREDAVPYDRDFDKDPVLVGGAAKDWNKCFVGCEFGFSASKTPDATFGVAPDPSVDSILRSMESSQYYSENNIDVARGRGYKIVMTTSLSSDVPVGYFSWAEYDIMAPVPPKTEEALAAAFISNCGARNFRLQALEMLENLDVKIDSYGSCHRNRDGKGRNSNGQ
uniref:Fucosyltransferase n=1 Tax=Arundo donax TaxID=35708 RepID=A0A0A9B735_ARUDO